MSQMFDDNGKVIPVTLIEAGPCYVTQIRTKEKDGYEAIQIGFDKIKKEKKIKKTMKGKLYRFLKEFRIKKTPGKPGVAKVIKGTVEEAKDIVLKVGDKIDVSIFKQGEIVNVSGISKGKGFAGGVKRHGFKDKAKAHGAKDMRRVGSIGGRWPQRVLKGKKMPGRMGSDRITVKNLKIVKIDKENNLLAIKGAIPGNRGTLLEIREKQ